MKNLIKIGFIVSAVIAFASCEKTEFDSAVPCDQQNQQTTKAFHLGTIEDIGGNLLADRDKCKKCHTATGKTMGLDWSAPYMSDNRYNSIEELIDNYDFENNVHLVKGTQKSGQTAISEEQKNELISYLKSLEKNPIK